MQDLQAEMEKLRSAARTRDHEVSQLREQIERLTLEGVGLALSHSHRPAEHYAI